MNGSAPRIARLLVGIVAVSISFVAGLGSLHARSDGSSQAEKTRSFALIVANNDSVDPDVASLEFADDDGARYYELFRSVADDVALLTQFDTESRRIFPKAARRAVPPSRDQLEREVERLSKRIERAREKGETTELYLVFTGHGNVDDDGAGYLSLLDSKLRRSELYRDVIRPIDSDFTHLVVDACHAYHMVHSRGGGDDWSDDRSGETLDRQLAAYLADRGEKRRRARRSIGVIVSTAGTAEVHEWSRYRSGVFSHELRSGLLGAADADGDGDVTYPELEAYLVAANAAVTNPKARIDVYAHPPRRDRDRAMTSLDEFEDATILEIPTGRGGRFHLEDSRGLRYADFHVVGSSPTRVALLRAPLDDPTYYLRRNGREAEIPLDGLTVRSSELAFHEASHRSRGSVGEAFRNNLFETPFGPSFVAGFHAGRRSRPTPRREPRPEQNGDDWRLVPSVGYGAGPSLDRLYTGDTRSRVEHHLDARVTFRHRSGWGVGPFVSYGVWFPASETSLHRFSGGLEGSYRFRLAPELTLRPAVRVGHTGYLLDHDRLRSDPLGFRTAAAASVSWQIGERVALFAEPGLAASLYTIDAEERPNRERWFLSPTARIGLSF